MKEPDLYKFFAGEFSEKEKLHLKQYLECFPEYYSIFLEKRKIYNRTLFKTKEPAFNVSKAKTQKFTLRKRILKISKVAAIFLLALVSFIFIDKYTASEKQETAYQSIHVPLGQRINLELPDGSKIWLNAGSTLKYPTSFDQKNREVSLEGEAYFEVSQNIHKPFHVIAGSHRIEVLGTKFNVNVDTIKHKFETALFEGSVKVTDPSLNSVKLEPNTSIKLIDGKLTVSPLLFLDRFNWREGLLCFDKERFEDIMSVFEKSYGYNIVIKNHNVNKYLFTGKFIQSDGIDYALNLLQESIRFSYSREKNTKTIIIN